MQIKKQTFAMLCATVVAMSAGCGKSDKKPDIDNNSSGNPITAPVDYLGAVNKAKKTAVKTVDLASIQQAINLFQANEDRFPTNLQEVVTKNYIREIPAAPSGYRLTYDPRTGSAKMLRQ
jgi:hypothetical protein